MTIFATDARYRHRFFATRHMHAGAQAEEIDDTTICRTISFFLFPRIFTMQWPDMRMDQLIRTFRVRSARHTDIASMPIIEQSAGELFRTIPDLAYLADAENLSARRYRDLVNGGWCFVVDDHRLDLCGFICAEALEGELHIYELAMRRDCQNLGIGRHLVNLTIDAARRHRLASITLTTFADVPWNAPFYERLGFRRLAPEEIGVRLKQILQREKETGLPMRRRCAMRLTLDRMEAK